MAKTKTSNGDLFKGFNPPVISEPKKEAEIIDVELEEPVEKHFEQVAPIIEEDNNGTPFVFKRGRPKEIVGEIHQFSARINMQLWDLAVKTAEKQYGGSVNAYINYLIAKDQGLL